MCRKAARLRGREAGWLRGCEATGKPGRLRGWQYAREAARLAVHEGGCEAARPQGCKTVVREGGDEAEKLRGCEGARPVRGCEVMSVTARLQGRARGCKATREAARRRGYAQGCEAVREAAGLRQGHMKLGVR